MNLLKCIPLVMLTSFMLMACSNNPTSSNQPLTSTDSITSELHSSTSGSSTDVEEKEDKVCKIYDVPIGLDLYKDAKLYINEEEIPLINVKVNDSHTFGFPESTRIDSAVARIAIKGRITLTLKTNYEINSNTKIYPSAFNIIPITNALDHTISFTLYSAGKYIIQPNNDGKKAIQLFVDEYKEQEDELEPGYLITHIKKGIWTKDNCSYIDDKDNLILRDKTILYLDEGAVLRCKVASFNCKDIIIKGNGIIDGSTFSRKQVYVPVNFGKCENIQIKDITILDPAAWTLNLYFCKNVTIDNVKIISSRANGDGITVQSCHNVIASDCYVRGFDDNLVVKNYANPYGDPDRSKHGTTDNIKFTNCFLWTDLAQSMEIGFETVGKTMTNIEFDNITVFHNYHKPIISIHNANYAVISDVKFTNITVESADMGSGDAGPMSHLIDISCLYSHAFSDKACKGGTEIGSINGVVVNNVLVKGKRSGLNLSINVQGWKDTRLDERFNGNISMTENVTIQDVKMINKTVDENYPYIFQNQYTKNIKYINSGNKISGASLVKSWDKDYLDSLSDKTIIIKNAVN